MGLEPSVTMKAGLHTMGNDFVHSVLLLALVSCDACGAAPADNLQRELRHRNERDGLWLGVWRQDIIQLFAPGDDRRQEVRLPRSYFGGFFLPDGKRVLASWRDQMFLLTLNGDIIREWKGMFGTRFATMSSDARKVALTAVQQDSTGTATLRYYWALVESPDYEMIAEETVVQSGSEPEMLSWSPDGAALVVSLGGEVRMYDLPSKTYKSLGRGLDPTWSPDGRWIAFRTGDGRAILVKTETWISHEIIQTRKVLYGLQWSPDSRYVLFSEHYSSGFCSTTRLVVYRISDGATQPVLSPCLGWTNRDFGWVILKNGTADR